jgi:N-dimethylarginine dimethylaminohydrolase
MVAPLRKVMVRRPDRAFAVENPEIWHYAGRPDLIAAQKEHDLLVEIVRQHGAEIFYHEDPLPGLADSIYVFDPAIVTDKGAVILKMGKTLRRGEEDAIEQRLSALGIPIIGRLEGEARAEGGDFLWLDSRTLAAGIGFRTNREGVRQLKQFMRPLDVEIVEVDLPYWQGPEACLHLLSMISLVAADLAVVYPALLPVRVCQELEKRGIEWLEVPDQEFLSMGTNVLALEPRKCLMLEGNPVTRKRLERAGCQVFTYKGDEISLKAEGGPTCLTRPILRELW